MFTTKWQPQVTSPGNHRHYIRSKQPASFSYLALTVATHIWVVLGLQGQCLGDTTHTFCYFSYSYKLHMCYISCILFYVILFELPLFNKHMKLTQCISMKLFPYHTQYLQKLNYIWPSEVRVPLPWQRNLLD